MRLITLLIVASAAWPAAAHAQIEVARRPDGLEVTDGGWPVLFYRTKPADPAEPGRLNFVHPLHAPDGAVLTEDRPADHVHHRGVFWSWRQVRLHGEAVADGWLMKGLTFETRDADFRRAAGGAAALTVKSDWILTSKPEPLVIARETTRVTVHPLAHGARRVEFATEITPAVEGLALGGSDDAKGYGGFSVRLIRPDLLSFASGGAAVQPAPAAVGAGAKMAFSWPAEPGVPAWTVTLSCTAEGQPITRWILRRELSMQNCVFPGRAPYAMARGRPLRLQAELVVKPREAEP